MLLFIGVLTFLCFLILLMIVTIRTQHTLFAGHVHLDNVWATPTFRRADLYRLTIRQKISVGAIISYLQKLRNVKTSKVLKQFFFLKITLFSMCFCFIAFSLKLNTFSF